MNNQYSHYKDVVTKNSTDAEYGRQRKNMGDYVGSYVYSKATI